jgi:CheY-like chemotaxis protein
MADVGQKVVVLYQGTTFTTNAVIKTLKDSSYEISLINPPAEQLQNTSDDTRAMIIFLGDYLEDEAFMKYLSEKIQKFSLKVILVGDRSELDKASGYLESSLISQRFEKPFSVGKIIDAVRKIYQDEQEKTRKNILVVDDDMTFLKVVRSWLTDKYNVVPVTSGAQALQYLAQRKPDLILLDYEMPVLNGPMVLESIRAEENLRDIPVFFLTGVDEKSQVTQAIKLKPEGYLLKSFDKDKVLNALDSYFSKH